MANMDFVVKGLVYSFEKDDIYKEVEKVATRIALERSEALFLEEKEFQEDELAMLISKGEVKDLEEYKKKVLKYSPTDIDYSKSFEENKSHPSIIKEVNITINKSMQNVYDLPCDVVITLDESNVNENGTPSEELVRATLKEKFGDKITVTDYRIAEPAKKIDILSYKSYEKIGEMLKTNDYQIFLNLRANIQNYSANNIGLIYAQNPEAKAVMGFNAWKKFDRHVDAGQTGIAIWQPYFVEVKTEKEVDHYINTHYKSPNSKEAVKEKERLMKDIQNYGKATAYLSYKQGAVFDIMQTVPNDPEHDNFGDIINLHKPFNKDLENYAEIEQCIKVVIGDIPINSQMSQQDALFDAISNYTDKLLTEAPSTVVGIKSNIPLKGDMHKIETNIATCMICKHIGIESGDKATLKLAEIFNKELLTENRIELGKREMFMKGFDRASKLYDQFVKEFDKAFGIDIEAQREAIKAQKEVKDFALNKKKEKKERE